MSERWRRLRFALRWAWTGEVRYHGPVTVLCHHTQLGDLVLIETTAIRGVASPVTVDWTVVGSGVTTALLRVPKS